MTQHLNNYQQPVGFPLPEWQPRALPQRVTLSGRTCRLEPFRVEAHGRALYQAWQLAPDGRDWTWMPVEPFASEEDYLAWARNMEASRDPLHFTVIDLSSGQPTGTLALMRIDAQNGVVEVGHVTFSRLLRRSTVATEAHFLLMQYAIEQLGYRRYEWKCDNCNAPSKAAALRLGFQQEGVFRQVVVYKGRNRDTAWFSIIDGEWPRVKQALQRWLAADNFSADGQQRQRLETLREEAGNA